MWNGFVKVGQDYCGRVWHVELWNPVTKEVRDIACEDTDYNDINMGLVDHDIPGEERIRLLCKEAWFDGDDAIENAYRQWRYDKALEAGRVLVGMIVRVVKGRKWPVGMEGRVIRFQDWKDQYGRVRTTYCVLEDGKRVDINNVVPIAYEIEIA